MVQYADEELKKIVNLLTKLEEERTKAELGLVRKYCLQRQLIYKIYRG